DHAGRHHAQGERQEVEGQSVAGDGGQAGPETRETLCPRQRGRRKDLGQNGGGQEGIGGRERHLRSSGSRNSGLGSRGSGPWPVTSLPQQVLRRGLGDRRVGDLGRHLGDLVAKAALGGGGLGRRLGAWLRRGG